MSAEELAKHARVINNLRRRVEALEVALAALTGNDEGATPSTAVEPAPPTGEYRPSGLCLACASEKEVGREDMLTCIGCGRARNEAIRGKGERAYYDTCGNCRHPKARSTTLLCSPCSKSFKRFQKQE